MLKKYIKENTLPISIGLDSSNYKKKIAKKNKTKKKTKKKNEIFNQYMYE